MGARGGGGVIFRKNRDAVGMNKYFHITEGCAFEDIPVISPGETGSLRSFIYCLIDRLTAHEVVFQGDPVVVIIHEMVVPKVSKTETLTKTLTEEMKGKAGRACPTGTKQHEHSTNEFCERGKIDEDRE